MLSLVQFSLMLFGWVESIEFCLVKKRGGGKQKR